MTHGKWETFGWIFITSSLGEIISIETNRKTQQKTEIPEIHQKTPLRVSNLHIKCIIISGRRWQQHFCRYLFWAAALFEQNVRVRQRRIVLFVSILLLRPERNAFTAAVQELYHKNPNQKTPYNQLSVSSCSFFVSLVSVAAWSGQRTISWNSLSSSSQQH